MATSKSSETDLWPLMLVVRAIIRGNGPKRGISEEARVESVMTGLLGKTPNRGRPKISDDELLELIAFDYSLPPSKNHPKPKLLFSVARSLVLHHPQTRKLSVESQDSTARRLVKKFDERRSELLDFHGYQSDQNRMGQYSSVALILREIGNLGIAVDESLLSQINRSGT